MRTHPHLVHARQQGYGSGQQQSSYGQQSSRTAQDMQSHHYGMPDPYGKTQKRPLGSAGTYLPQQRSFSSSEEELRSTPEFEGEFFIHFFYISLYCEIR
jgi:hypothetical protein